MRFSDETLMAFADGELDEQTRREVELALRDDPALAEKVRQHKAMRSNVFNAFSSTLAEEVPQRLQAAARSGKVVHLDSVRQVRTPPPVVPPEKPGWAWPQWGALAATLVVGVLAGVLGSRSVGDGEQLAAFDRQSGALAAQGPLAQALSQQLASAAPANPDVKVGISFVARDGHYCRSFMLPGTAGLACRSRAGWQIPVMVNSVDSAAGDYRQAGSALPQAVLDAIDARIAGQALDAAGEKTALQQGWKTQKR